MKYKTPIFSWLLTIAGTFFLIGLVWAAESMVINHLTWAEIMVSCGSFSQMIAALGCIPFLFLKKKLILSKRSWAIFTIGMATILVRRSLSIWSYMGYSRVTVGEMAVAAILSILYIAFEVSVLVDTIQQESL